MKVSDIGAVDFWVDGYNVLTFSDWRYRARTFRCGFSRSQLGSRLRRWAAKKSRSDYIEIDGSRRAGKMPSTEPFIAKERQVRNVLIQDTLGTNRLDHLHAIFPRVR